MTIAEFIYTVLLKPKPLQLAANAVIRAIVPRTVKYGAVTIVLNPRDAVISGALTFHQYEHDETALAQKVPKEGMTVLDIGANVGFYTAQFAHAITPSGTVYAFEPDPECHSFLLQTIAAISFTNVHPIQAAASSKDGSMELFTSSQNRGDNRLYSNEMADGSTTVKVLCIDNFLAERKVSQIDFIKIDVQGFEGSVLSGLEQTFRQSKPLTILMEFWPDGLERAGTNPASLLRQLQSWGMSLNHLGANGATSPVGDIDSYIAQYPGRKYTNIVATKAA